MTVKPVRLAQKLLNEISSDSPQGVNSSLNYLIEAMEEWTKDPDAIEIHMISTLYNIVEQLSILEGQLKLYVNDDHSNIGKKLDQLYNRKINRGFGSFKA
jgi:hypothetical protein